MTETEVGHLAVLLASGDVAYLVGDGINAAASVTQPAHTELRAAIGATTDVSFFTAAQELEASGERHALITALISVARASAESEVDLFNELFGETVEECIDIGVTGGLSTQLALSHRPRRIQVSEDVGYNAASIYAPFGSLETPKHVVLTRDDLVNWSSGREAVFSAIRALANKKHLVSLLHADELEKLEEVHRSILEGDTGIGKRPVLIAVASAPLKLEVWRRRGYMVIAIDEWSQAPAILRSIPRRPRCTAIKDTAEPKEYATPYKFLDFFTEDDRDRFFGRDSDIGQLHRQILDRRATLVLGSSGVGKTSLINAGVVPKLRDDGVLVALARPFEQPLRELTAALLLAIPEVRGDLTGESLADEMSLSAALAFATSDTRPTVVIVDQFEEVFTKLGRAERDEFARQVAQVLARRFPGLHLVFVMRHDFVHHLLNHEPDLSALIEGRYALSPFDRARAHAALVGLADAAVGWDMEAEVVDTILDDLAQPEGIDPSQLQIVCTSLYERFHHLSSVDLHRYREVGGAAGLLEDYLEGMLADLGTDEDVAREVLKAMVTISRTKSVASLREIEHVLAETGVSVSPNPLTSLLGELVRRRVIRPVDGEGVGPHYELAHDLLAARVYAWLSADEVASKYARHVLKTCASDWRLTGVMPEPGAWQQIRSVPPTGFQNLTEAVFAVVAAAHHNESDEVITSYIERATEFSADWRDEIVAAWDRLTITARLGLVRLTGGPSSSGTEILDLAEASPVEALKRAAARTRRVSNGLPRFAQTETEWIFVAGGPFLRGTDHPDFKFSGPPREIFVSSFYIQKFPVTCADYAVFVAETGHQPPRSWPSEAPDPWLEDHPVVEVSWDDAVAYCGWFGAHSGLDSRLPTEAEWEKAATWHPETQTKTLWSWGNEFNPALANIRESGLHSSTPVGYFSPAGDSPYGVVEMCGNTFDWVADWWSKEYSPENIDPRGPESGTARVARGGSWAGSWIDNTGCSHAYMLVPTNFNEYVGFRMARSESQNEGT